MTGVAFYGLLPDRNLERLAVDPVGLIPFFELADGEEPFWQDVGLAADRFSEMLGSRVWVLRPLFVERTPHRRVRVYGLESERLPADRSRPIKSLQPQADLPSWAELLSPLEKGVPDPRDVPWYRPGWRPRAQDWISETLAVTGEVKYHQRHHWGISAVIEVHHRDHRYFFKAAPPMFPHEARVTSQLAEQWPERLAQIVAAETDRNWMLMDEVEGPKLSEVPDQRYWLSAISAYAEMQVQSSELSFDLDHLPADVLHQQSLEMLDDTEALQAGDYGLDTKEISAVRSTAKTWLEAFRDLAMLRLPLIVEHGDLHAGQVISTEQGPVFLDWSDAALTVPFGLMNLLLDMHEEDDPGPWGTLEASAQALATAFLEPWYRVDLGPQMEEAQRLMRIASPLLRSLPYWRMVRLMENDWEMQNVMPYFLRQAV